ncbi:MAG: hypothetical protein H0T46_21670 [Deltaproteobacteria bacterium]|nr:hypothetical protein [Deltaproteobacteria bacterium]
MWVHALADATPSCGGKALGLARLLAAGLPVPPGFVIEDAAFRAVTSMVDPADESAIGHLLEEAALQVWTGELPDELGVDVFMRAEELGPLIVVRSSATIEDGEAGAGAGVFSSSQAVPAGNVWSNVREVWASALTPMAAAYGRRRGATISIGVIIQRFVEGERLTVYTRALTKGDDDAMLIQRGSEIERVPRYPLRSDEVSAQTREVAELALRAEAAIGAREGADVELIVGDQTWIVQARPIVRRVTTQRPNPPPALLAALVADGRIWTWDIGHNPDPLSPAQIALVDRVDRAGDTPYAMRVCAGYLYTTPREPQPIVAKPTSREELIARFTETETRLANALGIARRSTAAEDDAWSWHAAPADPPPLDEALDRYVAACRIYSTELTPLVASARSHATPLVGARRSAVEATLLDAGRHKLARDAAVDRLSFLAPAWDVAVPTYGELPGVLHAAVARAQAVAHLAPERSDPDDLASKAADLAERDDLWFARAQLLVRKAIQARADKLGISRDDAFWIPLDDLLAAGPLDPDDVRRRASAARAAASRAANWLMPRTIGGGEQPSEPSTALRGVGTGPRVTGRIVRFATLASTVTVGSADVVVARAVTPALAVQVIGCAAIVSESGGLLDHGAALARELGITCVVGCHDAWSMLADGMVVTVDGDRGTVEIET